MSLFPIAQVSKSYGKDGQVLLKVLANIDIQDYCKGPIFIIFDGLPVPFFIDSLKPKGVNSYIVNFSTIRDLPHAEEIAGRQVYAENLAQSNHSDYSLEELEGYTLIDQNGQQLGTVSKVLIFPSNACLEIAPSQTLVPFHEDLIIELNSGSKSLTMQLPSGLF